MGRRAVTLGGGPIAKVGSVLPGRVTVHGCIVGVVERACKAFNFSTVRAPYMRRVRGLYDGRNNRGRGLVFGVVGENRGLGLSATGARGSLASSKLHCSLAMPLSECCSGGTGRLPTPFGTLRVKGM